MKRKSIKESDMRAFYTTYRKFYKTANKEFEYPNYFKYSFNKGKTVTVFKKVLEELTFDTKWILIIESYLPSIDKIIRDPRKTLTQKEIITPVEKATRTNQKSIQFLSTNSRYIQDYNKDDVKISKILSFISDDKVDIYENRFVMTLIERLQPLIDKTYEIVTRQKDELTYYKYNSKSDFGLYDEFDIEISIDANVKKRRNRKEDAEFLKLIQSIENVRGLVYKFLYSPFAKEMTGYKKVTSPIQRTNIIKNNPDFQNAYRLWGYLDSVSMMEFDLKIKDTNITLSENLRDDIVIMNNNIISSLLSNLNRKTFKINEQVIRNTGKIKQVLNYNLKSTRKAEDFSLQDTSFNEFYLNQVKNLLNRQNKKNETEIEESKEGTPLKKMLTDIVGMSNIAIKEFYKTEEEKGYFEKYLKESEPLDKKIDRLKYNYNVVSTLRNVKLKDIKETVKEEKKIIEEITKTNTKLILQKTKQMKDAQNKEIQNKLKEEIKSLKSSVKNLKTDLKLKIKEEKMNEQIRLHKAKIQEIERKRKLRELEKLNKITKAEKEKILKENKKVIEEINQKKKKLTDISKLIK